LPGAKGRWQIPQLTNSQKSKTPGEDVKVVIAE
jgi:hypothetical protein